MPDPQTISFNKKITNLAIQVFKHKYFPLYFVALFAAVGTAYYVIPYAATQTLTVIASDDASISNERPTTVFNTLSMSVSDGQSKLCTSKQKRFCSTVTKNTLLKFNVKGISSGTVNSAKIRIYSTNGATSIIKLYGAATNWDETSVTWDKAPIITNDSITQVSSVEKGTWVEFSLPSGTILTDGEYAFEIQSDDQNSVYFQSKESTTKPQLIVSYTPSPVAIASLAITGVTDGQTVSGDITVKAVPTNVQSVMHVDFAIDGVSKNIDSVAPYCLNEDDGTNCGAFQTTLLTNATHSLTISMTYLDSSSISRVLVQRVDFIVNNILIVPQQPPSIVRRFPGDPNPKVTGKAYWGAAVGGNTDPFVRHEQTVGKSLSIRRTFWQWDSDGNAGNGFQNTGMFSAVSSDLSKDRLPFISFKVPSWSTAGSGGYDSLIDDLLRKLDAYGKPIWIAFNHEPENDGLASADWRSMQTKIRQRMTAVGTKNIAFMPVLMAYTWNPISGRNPSDWWVASIWDAYIVDHYQENVASNMFSTPWNNFIPWIEAKGLPFGTAEWGNRGTDAQAALEMQGFWDWGFANKKDVIAYTYFDSGLNSPNGSWELTGEPLNKFRTITGGDSRVMRISDL